MKFAQMKVTVIGINFLPSVISQVNDFFDESLKNQFIQRINVFNLNIQKSHFD